MEDFIREYKDKDTSAYKKIIDWFEEHSELHLPGKVFTGQKERKVLPATKKSTDLSMTLNQAYEVEPIREAMEFLWQCVNDYLEDFPILKGAQFSMLEKINIQRYLPPDGGYKSWHTERLSSSQSSRMLTWMIYLNTVKDEGGTEFKYLNKKTQAEEGKVLIWPSDFTHEHRGVASPTERKYILTGWYNFVSL